MNRTACWQPREIFPSFDVGWLLLHQPFCRSYYGIMEGELLCINPIYQFICLERWTRDTYVSYQSTFQWASTDYSYRIGKTKLEYDIKWIISINISYQLSPKASWLWLSIIQHISNIHPPTMNVGIEKIFISVQFSRVLRLRYTRENVAITKYFKQRSTACSTSSISLATTFNFQRPCIPFVCNHILYT